MIYFRQVVSQALVVKADLGSDVEIYGMIGPNGGPYTVQIDDGSPVTLDAKSEYLTPQTLLYRCTGLGPGPHKVRMANAPFLGQTLGIDYAIVHRPPPYVLHSAARPHDLGGAEGVVFICRTGPDPMPAPPPPT